MSIPMVALKPQIYAGRRLVAGTEFTARGRSDARLLLALGRADFAMAEPEPVPAPVAVEPEVTKPKRQYKRRDMTAETAEEPAVVVVEQAAADGAED